MSTNRYVWVGHLVDSGELVGAWFVKRNIEGDVQAMRTGAVTVHRVDTEAFPHLIQFVYTIPAWPDRTSV